MLVFVELALLVELAVAVRVRFGDGLTAALRETSGDFDALAERDDEVDSVPPDTLCHVSLTKKGSPELGVRVATTDGDTAVVALAICEGDALGERDTLGEPLSDAVRVPSVALYTTPLSTYGPPVVAVGKGEHVDVAELDAVDDELPVELDVAVSVRLGDGLKKEVRETRGDLETLGDGLGLVDGVPTVPLNSVPFMIKSAPEPGVVVAAGDRVGAVVAVALIVRETRAERDALGERLTEADRVPPVPFTIVSLKTKSAPGEVVGIGDKLAVFVDVAVGIELRVTVLGAVSVRLGDGLTSEVRLSRGERDTLGEPLEVADDVPTVALYAVPFTIISAPEPGVDVARADGLADDVRLTFDVRVGSGDFEIDGDLLDVGLRVPPVPLNMVPFMKKGPPVVAVASGDMVFELVDVLVTVTVALKLAVCDVLTLDVRDARGDRETLVEPLIVDVIVPCVSLTTVPLNW